MINLGDAPEQKEGVGGPIPPKSIVKVRMELRKPKKPDPQDPAVTIYSSGLKGMDCEFTVIGGQFDGLHIWENWFLPPSMQTVTMTKGQTGACNGSFAKARAVIEAARGLDPNDPAANRTIQSWFDLNALEFPVKVGIQKPRPGDQYLNNDIAKVLTPGDEFYTEVMGGSEVITSEPIPSIPPATQSAPPAAGGASGWNGSGNGQQVAPPTQPAATPQINVPAWAQAQQDVPF